MSDQLMDLTAELAPRWNEAEERMRFPLVVNGGPGRRAHFLESTGVTRCGRRGAGRMVEAPADTRMCRVCAAPWNHLKQFLPSD